MNKFLKLTLAVVLLFGVTSASAQKFARVDLAAIIPAMPEYKEAETNLQAYALDLQNQLESINVEFNTKYSEYEKNKNTYSDSVLQIKERELMEMQQRISDFQQIAQQDLQKKEMEIMNPIYERANEAVKKVSQAAGYIAVFSTNNNLPAAGLAYFDPTALCDITPDVMKELGI